MAKIPFHLFNLFPMLLHRLILLLFISTVDSAPSTKQQNSNGHQTRKYPVTQDEIRAVDGNYQAVYIIRAIDRRAKVLAQLEDAAIETVRRNLPPTVRSDTLQSLWEVSLWKGGKYLWDSAKGMIGLGNNGEVPGTPTVLEEQEKQRRKMNQPQFWVELLRSSKLTEAEKATLFTELPSALYDEKTKKIYLKSLDKLLEMFEQNVKYLEQEMTNGMDQNVVGHKELRLKENDEGSSTNPHPAKSPLPHINLFQICHKICVGTVQFLAQIRLEILLYWDFRQLPNGDLTDTLGAYKQNPKIRPSGVAKELVNDLLDLSTAADKVIELMQPFQFAFPEPEDHRQQQGKYKYLTSIMEVAKMIDARKGTIDGSIWSTRLKELVVIWHKVVNLITPKMNILGIEMHKKLYIKLEMPKEWFADIKDTAHLEGPSQEPTQKMLINRVKFILAQTLLAYGRLNAFYMIEHYHDMLKGGQFSAADEGTCYHLCRIFSEYKCAGKRCISCKGPIVGHKP